MELPHTGVWAAASELQFKIWGLGLGLRASGSRVFEVQGFRVWGQGLGVIGLIGVTLQGNDTAIYTSILQHPYLSPE